MHSFDYVKPHSLEQVGELLTQTREGVHILAGGTELLLQIERGEASPQLLVDIKGLADLQFIQFSLDKGLMIGATTTISALMAHADVRRHYPLLLQACSQMATEQIRNRATVGGNVCSGFVYSDFAPVLMCYDAICHLWGPRGQRKMSISEFCREGARATLRKNEILVSIQLPTPWAESYGVYHKLRPGRGAHFALAGAAVFACKVEDKLCDWQIALTAIQPHPQRIREAEKMLDAQPPTDHIISQISEIVREWVQPVEDIRASEAYRKAMAGVMVCRGVRTVREALLGGFR